ncbi:MAG: hypothetical protein ABH824_06075 [Nanoarchaeota archaeon]|nr:hypothetical protein [Nanoarchaeota archaeon]MBU1632571.1 hypothetical protein [Nanoarchaeota archaeon]MBU1875782.1 hypothetical protein [Nanoarchaeota archaeon]
MRVSLTRQEESGQVFIVRNEPYKGFFKEIGFNPEYNDGFNVIEDYNSKIKKVFLGKNINQITPEIIADRVIYYEKDGICFVYDDMQISGGRKVKCTGLDEIVDREKNGEGSYFMIQQMLDKIRKAGNKAWHGHFIYLTTSSSS